MALPPETTYVLGGGVAIPVKQADNKDAKTTLNYFVQRYSGRMLLKGDVVYKSGKVSGTDMYQATVQLFCLDGAPVFAGELCREKKAAEQEAAKQALAAYDEEVSKMHEDPQTFKKARMKEKEDARRGITANSETLRACKQKIFELLAKHVMRTLIIGRDIWFQTVRQPDMNYVTKLTLPCLHGAWATMEFIGEAARGNRDAEGSACEKALELIDGEPDFDDARNRYQAMCERNDRRRGSGDTEKDIITRISQKDPKSFMQLFVQKLAGGKQLQQGDIVYTSIQVQSDIPGEFAYQATVQIMCLPDDPSFAGEVANSQQAAEANAARAALESFADEIAAWDGKKKRGRDGEPEQMEPSKKEKKARLNALFPYKGKLLELVMKIVRKAVTKEDINWVTEKDSTGKYICTLKIPCMPGHWSRRTWKGLPYDTVKEAELSTSQKAFDQIRVDPSFAAQVAMLEQGKKVVPKREQTTQSQKASGKGIDLRKGAFIGGGRSNSPDMRRRDSGGGSGITMLW
eukprot:TRINITY_DN3916_c0_g2_i1.p1 TRINITY_DN3916_c0_g2~~TRINITY_DN3916_c0_g2_i1.p1  ORF type:complete len:516 (+),score=142.20 TRINITY_DN3916_c0_g2_i1:104-1651(+)